jgi:hypothetical protein
MTARVLCLLLALGSCAKSAADLEPFPCAADGGCPEDMGCVPDLGCTTDYASHIPFPCYGDRACPGDLVCAADSCWQPGLDLPCTSAGCGDFGGICRDNLCLPRCGGGGICAADRVCSQPSSGVCLLSCVLDDDCPAGLACLDLWYDGRRGCYGQGWYLPACVSVNASQCGGETRLPGCSDYLTSFAGTCECVNGQQPAFACGSGDTCDAICVRAYGP